MAGSIFTPNLNLSKYAPNDVTNWLVDFNNNMDIIDTSVTEADTKIMTNATNITNLETGLANANKVIENLNTASGDQAQELVQITNQLSHLENDVALNTTHNNEQDVRLDALESKDGVVLKYGILNKETVTHSETNCHIDNMAGFSCVVASLAVNNINITTLNITFPDIYWDEIGSTKPPTMHIYFNNNDISGNLDYSTIATLLNKSMKKPLYSDSGTLLEYRLLDFGNLTISSTSTRGDIYVNGHISGGIALPVFKIQPICRTYITVS